MVLHETLDLRQGQARLRQVVQSELQEGIVSNQCLGLVHQADRIGVGDGYANSGETQGQKSGAVGIGGGSYHQVTSRDITGA